MEQELAELGLASAFGEAVEGADERRKAAVAKLGDAILKLASQNDDLRKKLLGPKSEKLRKGELDQQLTLFEGAEEALEVEADGELDPALQAELEDAAARERERAAQKQQPKRTRLPKTLQRETKEQKVTPDQRRCPCCGNAQLKPLGHDVSEQLEWVPGHFKLIEHKREKLSCPHCRDGLVVAQVPAKPIPKGIPGPQLLARVIADKYIKHLPLYRQADAYAIEHGVVLPVATMSGWVMMAALRVLKPIYQAMVDDVLQSKVIHTDDTSVRVQRWSASETGISRLWPYVGDAAHPHVVFDYTTSRKRDGPRRFLGDFEGYLQADAYGGYDHIYASGKVKEVACWAHARRYFIKARDKDPRRAAMALRLIARLFDVEARARRVSGEVRLALRRQQSAPLLRKLRELIDQFRGEVLPKGAMGRAVTYLTNQWGALTRYLEDADLNIDNNAAERAIRPIAVGRKNWLHIGSDRAGDAAAILYSLLCSCKLHEVDPVAYLADVLLRVHTHPAESMIELAPAAWKRGGSAAGSGAREAA